uniref:Fungal lipase-type domain-containing protein n=1 Tax=Arcella intermedia TaxID=1963864 RepID=A0A6B2LD26_9EUKA
MKVLVLVLICLGAVQGFNLKEADYRVVNAFAAYCASSALHSWNCFWCNESSVSVVDVVENTTTFTSAFVGIDHTHNEVIASFRGTIKTSIQNWITDLDLIQTQPYSTLPNVSVHEGFWKAYLSISTRFIKALKTAIASCPGCSRTVYTGHSLGGALASLALMDAVYYYQIPQPTPILYTFGQPRTGDSGWAQFMQQLTGSITRVVHNNDIVPHVPPKDFGYYHTPVEIWMPTGSVPYIVCDNSGEDPNCSDSKINLSVPDHLFYVGHNQTIGSEHGC